MYLQTIRLYEAINIQFNLLHIMSTQSIHGWHTLTYLAFSPFTTNKTNEVLQTNEVLECNNVFNDVLNCINSIHIIYNTYFLNM